MFYWPWAPSIESQIDNDRWRQGVYIDKWSYTIQSILSYISEKDNRTTAIWFDRRQDHKEFVDPSSNCLNKFVFLFLFTFVCF